MTNTNLEVPNFTEKPDLSTAFVQRGYLIGSKIGKGAFATVNTASYQNQEHKSIPLACKIIDKSKAPRDYLDKFLHREIQIIIKMNHPNIIKIHSIFERNSKIFVFMQHADNGNLLDFIRAHGRIRENEAKFWFKQLVSAIQYLHALDVAHRDIKCDNILLSKKWNVKLIDFGFAKYCPNAGNLFNFSKTYCGTATYAAPEILLNRPYNPKIADIWSMGVVLFILVNGSMPFDHVNMATIIKEQRKQKFHFNKRAKLDMSINCRNLLYALMECDVQKRITLDEILACKWFTEETDKQNSGDCKN